MSDRRELHERISETFEPKASLPDPQQWDCGPLSRHSPYGAWKIILVGGRPFTEPPKHAWEQLDYDTDESANARLLEAMPDVELIHSANGKLWRVITNWRTASYRTTLPINGEDCHVVDGADRKLAIVDAFCRWKNLTETGKEG